MGSSSVTVTVAASASIDVIDRPGYVLSSKERIAAVVVDDVTIKLGRLGITTDENIVALAGQLQTAFEELRSAAIARILARSETCQSPVCGVAGEHAVDAHPRAVPA